MKTKQKSLQKLLDETKRTQLTPKKENMKKTTKIKRGKICVRCGSKPYERPSGCSVYGKFWKRHMFQVQKYEEVSITK